MKTFKETLIERAAVNQQKELKKYITRVLKLKGIKITGSSRGVFHTRFALPMPEKDWKKFFAPFGLAVSDYSGSRISGTYFTYNLTTTKKVSSVEKGVTIPWVNSYSGKTAAGSRLFGGKELTPDSLGLAGKTFDSQKVMTLVAKKVKDKYEKPVADSLIKLLKQADTNKSSVDLDPNLNFKSTDLAKISSDYGEILASIWAMRALRFKKVSFPSRSNEPLVDFYGVRFGVEYPISVKSGGGGKVTIQNIIDAISKRAKSASKSDLSEEKSLVIFKTVNENNTKQGMVELHKIMKTKSIQALSKITKISIAKMSHQNLKEWVENIPREEQIKLLKPWWEINKHGKPSSIVLEGSDDYRLIGSPLGESIHRILNEDRGIKQSLINVARQVTLIQANVDVTNRKILFQSNYFKDADFKFDWAGYAGGNKLGFKMSLKK